MNRLKTIAAFALVAACGTLAPTALAQNQKVIERAENTRAAMRAGGKTIAGPGVYLRQPEIGDLVIQLTQATDVCGTISIVEGVSAQLNLLDAAGSNLQGVIADAESTRSVAVCANGVVNVELKCTGGRPCVAVWRVDSR